MGGMNVGHMLLWGQEKLNHLENPKLETEVLLAKVLGWDRVSLRTKDSFEIPFLLWIKFRWWVYQRSRGVPVAYIVGCVVWNDLKIKVNTHTLIPRDETEILAQMVAQNLKPGDKVLDLGTGSGCIGLYVKIKCEAIDLTLSDVSKKALKIAQLNFKNHKKSAHFVCSDLFCRFKSGTRYQHIIANLPYVPEGMKIEKEVKKEPSGALFSGVDGLDHYRRLEKELKIKNIGFEYLWIEFLPSQKAGIEALFQDFEIKFLTDSGGEVFFARIEK